MNGKRVDFLQTETAERGVVKGIEIIFKGDRDAACMVDTPKFELLTTTVIIKKNSN